MARIKREVAPEVLAMRPLSAREVAKSYGFDVGFILSECQRFIDSRGREGLRCFRRGADWKIRPANIEEWMYELERKESICEA
jgi:hypothetical protein